MEVLSQSSRRPLSARELQERAQAHHERLGLVTVYRTLEILERLGLVRRIHAEGSCHTFIAASPGHRHAITCERCSMVTEFDGDDFCLQISQVEATTGYRVSGHWLQLAGLCPTCRVESRE